MKNGPLLSIIVPVFNTEKYIRETINSILKIAETIDIEVIFHDSNSTDGTSEIIESFVKKYTFVVHYREKDNGQSDAINKGIKKSTGKWVTWLCADDLLLPGFSEMFLEAANSGCDIMYGDCIFLLQSGMSIPAIGTETHFEGSLAKKRMIIQQPGSCILKEKWDSVNGVEINLNWIMDYDLFLKLESNHCKFYRADKFISVARIHDDAKTSSGSVKRLFEYFKVLFRVHSKNLRFFSFRPYAVYSVEYLIKRMESKNRKNTRFLKGLHRYFWKVACPNEKEIIENRFAGSLTEIESAMCSFSTDSRN